MSLELIILVNVDPVLNHTFPIFNFDGSLVYPQYAYARKRQIIPTAMSALLAFFIPTVTFCSVYVLERVHRRLGKVKGREMKKHGVEELVESEMGLIKSAWCGFSRVVVGMLILRQVF